MILYRLVFSGYDGTAYRLDTTDPGKIGPWLAEMFGLFPFNISMQTRLDIQTSTWSVP